MTTEHQTETPTEKATEHEKSSSASKFAIGISAFAVIIAIGIGVALWAGVSGEDGPIAPVDRSDQGQVDTPQSTQALFEDTPVFDLFNRVVYIPVDERGVILSETTSTADRPATQAPSGVMLQRIHNGTMDLPFSTSDGPTGFSESGVPMGFSRTPQGAVLAAEHYGAFTAGGRDQLLAAIDAGVVTGFNRDAVESVNPDDLKPAKPLAARYVRVTFNPDLTLVETGVTVERPNGTVEMGVSSTPLVWREGIGWVRQHIEALKIGPKLEPLPGEGWLQWW